MMNPHKPVDSALERRQFIQWLSMSTLSLGLPLPFLACEPTAKPDVEQAIDLSTLRNVYDF